MCESRVFAFSETSLDLHLRTGTDEPVDVTMGLKKEEKCQLFHNIGRQRRHCRMVLFENTLCAQNRL